MQWPSGLIEFSAFLSTIHEPPVSLAGVASRSCQRVNKNKSKNNELV